jgi:hypothetical protein
VPIARARTKSLNRRIDRLIEEVQDPAEAVSIALRHTFRGIPEDPLCAWFVLRSGLPCERLLGVPAVEASEIAHRPLPSLPEEPGDSEE